MGEKHEGQERIFYLQNRNFPKSKGKEKFENGSDANSGYGKGEWNKDYKAHGIES